MTGSPDVSASLSPEGWTKPSMTCPRQTTIRHIGITINQKSP